MRRIVVLAVTLAMVPAAAAAQGSNEEKRFAVQAQGGPTIIGGGFVASGGFTFSPASRVDLVLNVERLHLPFERRDYAGSFGLTRGGDLTFVTGELRASFFPNDRLSPYALIGVGAGISRPTVNAYFPNEVKNDAKTVFVGAGVRAPLRDGLNIIGDVRAMLALEGYDGIVGAWPVRAGLEWRF